MRSIITKLALQIGAVFIAFMATAPFAYAYTILSAPNVPENYVGVNSGYFASTTSSGVAGSVLLYLQAKTPANISTQFWIKIVSDVSGQTCSSATTTLSDLAIPVFSTFTPGSSYYRVLPVGVYHTGDTSCNFGVNDRLEILPDGGFGPGGNLGMGGYNASSTDSTFQPWWLITTDTATSSIYEYQDTLLSVSTSSVQLYCDNLYTTSSIGGSIANGMCTVLAFLFIPDQETLNSFSTLQNTLAQKIPFSYGYDLQAIFQGLTASTSNNLSDIIIDFPQPASTSPLGSIIPLSITVLSTSTIGTYLPESVRQTFLGFQRVALWLSLAYLIYRRIIPHHVLETNHT